MGKDAHAMMEDDVEIRWARIREAQFGKSAAKLASLTKRLLPELCGGLWHTTHPDRFKPILSGGAILPEPNIPDGDRYCTGLGKDHYPYVRTLGGVSLFDFNGFDTDAYTNEYPSSTWATFVPYRTDWGSSVWIEINREQVAPDCQGRSKSRPVWRSKREPAVGTEQQGFSGEKGLWSVAEEALLPRSAFGGAGFSGLGLGYVYGGFA
jgi:hypothetical protein